MSGDPLSLNQRLHETLLGYLQTSRFPLWPGADGLTLQDALLSYGRAAAHGRVPDRTELLHRHPELAGELERFFANPAQA